MNRRSLIVATASLIALRANANGLAFIVTPLAEAILVTLKSTIGFFIKEWIPSIFKNSTLKSLATSVITAFGLTEAINRIGHWASLGSQTVAVGNPVTVDVAFANRSEHDVGSTFTMIALRDQNTGKDEALEHYPGPLRVAASSGLGIRITAHRLPTAGYKEIVFISDGKVVGKSPSIRVLA